MDDHAITAVSSCVFRSAERLECGEP
jgi:hypothetical protein